jgi:hypothetical protein
LVLSGGKTNCSIGAPNLTFDEKIHILEKVRHVDLILESFAGGSYGIVLALPLPGPESTREKSIRTPFSSLALSHPPSTRSREYMEKVQMEWSKRRTSGSI